MTIYLCRQHVQVGEEIIHLATTDKALAYGWAERKCALTRTKNYDVVECDDGLERSDI